MLYLVIQIIGKKIILVCHFISPALNLWTVVSKTGSGPVNPPPKTYNILPTDAMEWHVLGDGGLPLVITVSQWPFSKINFERR